MKRGEMKEIEQGTEIVKEKSLLGHAVQACEQAAREGSLSWKLYASGSLTD